MSIAYLITQIMFGVNSVAIEMHDSETENLGSTFGLGAILSNNNGNYDSHTFYFLL